MTYITYQRAQYEHRTPALILGPSIDFELFREPNIKIPEGLPKPRFMPSYLVRTFDMEVVPGSKVHEGYCALSYSWNQSGEISINATTGESYRIDKGEHRIIFPEKKFESFGLTIPGEVTFVTFEGLIQEICKDFNIKYIWYDQKCINQNDEEEKHREIHQMHKIYSNSYCTLALVPELDTGIRNPEYEPYSEIYKEEEYFSTAEWMKRMWTLEETIMSSKMLFVGRDFHCWSEQLENSIFHNKPSYDASTILYHAHARTSTKEHDHIFALANIFPDIIREIKIDYNQDIQELMIQFYGLLAKKDLSIMCFEMCMSFRRKMKRNFREEAKYKKPIQKFDLPSWTGVNGEHYIKSIFKTLFKNYTVRGRILQITCRGITSGEHRNLSLESIQDIIPPLPQQNYNEHLGMILVMHIRLPGTTDKKVIQVYKMLPYQEYSTEHHKDNVSKALRSLSHFLPIEKMDLRWVDELDDILIPWFDFDYLPVLYHDSAQYVLLSGVQFTSDGCNEAHRYPVIKKNGDYYNAIGMCEIRNDDGHLFDDMILEEQTFKIL